VCNQGEERSEVTRVLLGRAGSLRDPDRGAPESLSGGRRHQARRRAKSWRARGITYALVLLPALAAVGCSSSAQAVAKRLATLQDRCEIAVFFLEFDSSGGLSNPTALALARQELLRGRAPDEPYERVVVMSYGWNTELADANAHYVEILSNYFGWLDRQACRRQPPQTTAVVCVRWDSRFSVVEDAMDAVLPLPYLSSIIGWPFDTLLFPVSFWSRATAADRIGKRGLPDALQSLLGPEPVDGSRLPLESKAGGSPQGPAIYLVGHSFGGRILSNCIATAAARARTRASWLDGVQGALLIQPATHDALMPEEAPGFPFVITHNTFDKANKLLYPLANLGLNTATSQMLSYSDPGEEVSPDVTLDRQADNPGTSSDSVLEGRSAGADRSPAEDSDGWDSHELFVDGALLTTYFYSPGMYRAVGGSMDGATKLAGIWWFSSMLFEIEYIAPRTGSTAAVTFSELPILGWPIQTLGAAVTDDPYWGRRGSGLLAGGRAFQSAGASPLWSNQERHRVMGYERFMMEPWSPVVTRVDLSTVSTCSAFGYDMDSWWGATFFSWLDPLGTHSDYADPDVHALIDKVLTSRAP
jgi:hypothetical protein